MRARMAGATARGGARWLALAGLLGVLGAGAPARASDNGLRVLAVTPATGGTAWVQVEVLDPALEASLKQAGAGPERFRVAVEEAGGRVTSVRHLPDEAQASYTLLAFDQSGSFAAHWAEAFGLAGQYADALRGQPRHTVGVMTFGARRVRHCEESSAPRLRACLGRVERLGARQQVTRLKFYAQEAVREAARKQPLARGGSREVIVFTDAGDESQALDVREVAAEARELGVRVHVVCFPGGGRGLARRLDEMQQLAEGSGGRYLQVDDVRDPARAMRELARASERLYWLQVAFCGVRPGQAQARLSVEALTEGTRTHWSRPVRFRQSAEGASTEACQTQPAAASTPTASSGGAASPGTSSPPGSGGTASTSSGGGAAGPVSASPRDWLPWLLVLLGLAALALFILLVLWVRRRERGQQAPAALASPPAPVPAPVPALEPEPASPPVAEWRDPFVTLPETRLEVLRGPTGLEPLYRVHKSPFRLGARVGEMDLVLEHPSISGHHATVQLFRNGNLFVLDEHSTNGTFVDGRRLGSGERVQVRPGQRVCLGAHVELQVVQPAQQARVEPAGAPPLAVAPPLAPPAPAPPVESPRAKMKTLYAPVRGEDE